VPHRYLLTRISVGLAVLSASGFVGACTTLPGPTSTPEPSYEAYRIDTGSLGDTPCAGTEIEKLVIGVDSADNGRIWGVSATGSGDKRWTIVWPLGFTGRKGPDGVEVLDRTGKVIAREGMAVQRAQVCPLDNAQLLINAFLGFNMPSSVP
jgi:hypothetical protein